jgi:subtilase family serine protease
MPVTGYRLQAACAVAVAGTLITGAVNATAHNGPAPRASISGTHQAWASRANAVASKASSGTVSARVYLVGQDPAGLRAYAAAVSAPGSPLYRHYLSPAQLQARFGPSAAQVSALRSWLTGAGLKVTAIDAHIGGYMAVSGSTTAAGNAFRVTFGEYKGPDGHVDRAPQQAASAPGTVAPAILTVTGLDTATQLMKPGDTLPPPGPNYWEARPCSAYYGQKIATSEPPALGQHSPWSVCGYTPQQIRAAYGATASGMTGRGQTVAVVDAYASPTMKADADEYSRVTGNQPFAPGQYQQIQPSPFTQAAADECDAQSWYTEQALDVEAVHASAPGASVRYVAAASCQPADLASALAYIVQNDTASIVSNSWGEPADLTAPYTSVIDQIFEAGATEGIGFFFSSGDQGYESPDENPGSDQIQVMYPASSPWVTSVGGTSLAIGPRDAYEFETSWGTLLDPLASNGSWQSPPPGDYPADYDGSGGGGVSTSYPQPSYQQGVVPASLAAHLPDGTTSPTPMRVVPDVSAVADPGTGFLIGQTALQPNGRTLAFSLSSIGGTSLATPVFAGIEADAQQAAGQLIGFANPAIYSRYGTTAFRDVTDSPAGAGARLFQVRDEYTDPYTRQGPILTYLRTPGMNGEGAAALPATRGYDDATGVGSPWRYIESFLP